MAKFALALAMCVYSLPCRNNVSVEVLGYYYRDVKKKLRQEGQLVGEIQWGGELGFYWGD